MPLDPIELEIDNALEALVEISRTYRYTRDYDWTNAVKAIFGAIGKGHGYESYYGYDGTGNYTGDESRQHIGNMLGLNITTTQLLNSNVPDYSQEREYDILWTDKNQKILVAESEWGSRGKVIHDFQRLLGARCKYKVMIFNTNPGGKNNLISELENKVRNLTQQYPNERYLLCPYIRDEFQGSILFP